MMHKRVSVIICSLDRRDSLHRLLQSLEQLDYNNFEVIITLGPSIDDSEKYLARYANRIKIAYCLKPNISASRNAGLSLSSGHIVAFIDDDALPAPSWLKRIIAGFDSDETAAVGGPIYTMSPFSFQTRFTVANRFGDFGKFFTYNPSEFLNLPYNFEFPTLIGTNSAFRRNVILNLKGFDENYMLCLDEVDLCLRIINHGYKIKQLDNAFIYHYLQASPQRVNERYLINDYVMIRNRIYYCRKHASPLLPKTINQIFFKKFMKDRYYYHANSIKAGIEKRNLRSFLLKRINRAYNDGEKNQYYPPKYLTLKTTRFLQFKENSSPKNLAFVIPHSSIPEQEKIISTYLVKIKSLVSNNHIIHILLPTQEASYLNFEDGIWIHHLHLNSSPPPQNIDIGIIDENLWRYSYRIYKELYRINAEYTISLAISPINGLTLLASLYYTNIPIITDLNFIKSGTTFSSIERFIIEKSNRLLNSDLSISELKTLC